MGIGAILGTPERFQHSLPRFLNTEAVSNPHPCFGIPGIRIFRAYRGGDLAVSVETVRYRLGLHVCVALL